jgi:hypothetical protein
MMRATRAVVDGGDLAGSLGLADRLREEWLQLRPESPVASLTRAGTGKRSRCG